jgi:hypothetical protein
VSEKATFHQLKRMTNASSGKFTVDDTRAFIDTNLEKANFYIAVTRPQISGAPTRAPG